MNSTWIPTSERLPDEGERVLIYIAESKSGYTEVACRFTDNPPNAWSCGGDRIYAGVTHWQPLPEPPK